MTTPPPSPASAAADLLDTVADGVVAVDNTGVIHTWNPAATRLLGFTAEQAIGQTLALIIPPDPRPAHINGFHRAMESGTLGSGGRAVHVTACSAGRSPIELEMILALRSGGDGVPAGAIATLRPAGPLRALADYAPNKG